jgi:hypothetical protein
MHGPIQTRETVSLKRYCHEMNICFEGPEKKRHYFVILKIVPKSSPECTLEEIYH